MTRVMLFPGQGAQRPGMLDFIRREPDRHHGLLADLESTLGFTLDELDSEQALRRAGPIQISLFLAGVASHRDLVARGAQVDLVAGFSIGTFSAAVASGAYTFRELLPVVALRAALMESAYPHGYGMLAVVGERVEQLARWVEQSALCAGNVYRATINASNQNTFAGTTQHLELVADQARLLGFTGVHHLDVPTPSHCPLLRDVSDGLAAALDHIPAHAPAMAYLSNTTTRIVQDAAAIRFDLQANVSHMINWREATNLMLEYGATCFVEALPSSVLTRLGEANPDNNNARWCAIQARGFKYAADLLQA